MRRREGPPGWGGRLIDDGVCFLGSLFPWHGFFRRCEGKAGDRIVLITSLSSFPYFGRGGCSKALIEEASGVHYSRGGIGM